MNLTSLKRVSIIIPTVRQVDLVEYCLRSLSRNTDWPNYEVIVVDDGSDSRMQKELTRIVAHYHGVCRCKRRNTGFAATVNEGVSLAKGDFILLVNNDIKLFQPDWLRKMVAVLERPRVGVVGARLLYPNGKIQHAGVQYLPSIRNFDHTYRNKPADYSEALATREVLAVTGALMMIRREVWNQLNGMSEVFFIAMEDVDFCLRARAKGWRIVYCGQAVAYHIEGKTRGTTPENKVRYWYYRELEGISKFRKIWFDEKNVPLFRTDIALDDVIDSKI